MKSLASHYCALLIIKLHIFYRGTIYSGWLQLWKGSRTVSRTSYGDEPAFKSARLATNSNLYSHFLWINQSFIFQDRQLIVELNLYLCWHLGIISVTILYIFFEKSINFANFNLSFIKSAYKIANNHIKVWKVISKTFLTHYLHYTPEILILTSQISWVHSNCLQGSWLWKLFSWCFNFILVIHLWIILKMMILWDLPLVWWLMVIRWFTH